MRKGPIIFWSIFIAAAIFRVLFSLNTQPHDIGPCIKQIVLGNGIVNEDPETKESGQVLVIKVSTLHIVSDDTDCNASFLLKVKTKLYPKFAYGDMVNFKGRLLKPMNFLNKEDPGRQFDYEGYLAKSNIYYEMKSAEVATNQSVEPIRSNFVELRLEQIKKSLFSIKRNFVNNLKQHLGEPHAALASGLVVGEKAALPSDLLMDFRIVGLIHIVVLSGYNITIVGAAIRKLLSFLPRVWGIVLGGLGIATFGILVGGGATVVRSCFMAGVALSALVIRRDYDVTRALMFVGLIMLIQNPMILLHDPSFQLSFLATLGLVLLAGPVEKRLGFIPEGFGMRSVVASTVATQIFVSPYILYMMGNISIIGVIVNILVLPVIPITMLFVFLTGSVGMISSPIADILSWFTHVLLSYELLMVETFARLPFASVHIPAFSKWWVVGFYAVFAGLYWRRRSYIERIL
ncbi:MAG: ComEC/Rec2 family competence protein [Candidatus Taylorbacteria bacterium]